MQPLGCAGQCHVARISRALTTATRLSTGASSAAKPHRSCHAWMPQQPTPRLTGAATQAAAQQRMERCANWRGNTTAAACAHLVTRSGCKLAHESMILPTPHLSRPLPLAQTRHSLFQHEEMQAPKHTCCSTAQWDLPHSAAAQPRPSAARCTLLLWNCCPRHVAKVLGVLEHAKPSGVGQERWRGVLPTTWLHLVARQGGSSAACSGCGGNHTAPRRYTSHHWLTTCTALVRARAVNADVAVKCSCHISQVQLGACVAVLWYVPLV